MHILVSVLWCFLCFQRIPFKNIFNFTTTGEWDCVAAVERVPALHYSVDFIFLSFGIMGFIVELLFSCHLGSWLSMWNFETTRGSLMRPK